MSIAKKTLNTLVASAFFATLSLAATQSAQAHDPAAPKGKEKCYGVVKAGMNDCGALDGAHSCARLAKLDNSSNDWAYVPKGLCHKLVGGKLAEESKAEAQAE
jgi:uncharacterized membrane protein|tara:strand:- start:151 stop:459 length:309 start_codon:yes stop_codon:yes gene_type:complete